MMLHQNFKQINFKNSFVVSAKKFATTKKKLYKFDLFEILV